MEYFVGLDVSMAETQICVVTQSGDVVHKAKVPSTPGDIAAELAQVPPCRRLDPGVVIRAERGEWHPRMPERLDEEELAAWRAGRDAIYQLAALTVGYCLAVADG